MHKPLRRHGRRLLVIVAAVTVVSGTLVGTSACGTSGSPAADAGAGVAPTSPVASSTGPIAVRDAWVKAADSGMTAAFATLVNTGDADVTVVSAASTISPVEMHEVAMAGGTMQMRPKAGGFVIPAGGTHVLEPGGDHLMLMAVATPVMAGDEVDLTLTLDDGRTVLFTAVAKPFAGGNESYDPGGMASPGAHG